MDGRWEPQTSPRRRGYVVTVGLCSLALLTACEGVFTPEELTEVARDAFDLEATMTPKQGPANGGTRVTIRGSGFTAEHVLLLDGSVATHSLVNSGLIEFTTPPHDVGSVNLVLQRDSGTGRPSDIINVVGQFEYLDNTVIVRDVSPQAGSADGGTEITITGERFKPDTAVLFGGFLGANTRVISDKVIATTAPAQAPGMVDIALVTPGEASVVLPDAYEYMVPALIDNGEAPRLVGATSLDNNTVLVTFNKPMSLGDTPRLDDLALVLANFGEPVSEGDFNNDNQVDIDDLAIVLANFRGPGQDVTEYFEITGSETAFLAVSDVQQMSDMQTFKLTTLTQDYDLYTLHVVGLKDVFGRELATPQGLLAAPVGGDPTRTAFRGTAPTQEQIDFDTDGDGFGDWFEMKGWTVTIRFANGTEESFHTTSDPFSPDTDLDGLDDSVENQYSLDPRTNDTDADQISDFDEFNIWFSDPISQDSDGDGLADPLEIEFFHTSPILEDTDGDQWSDTEEILNRNRNPRRADIPLPQVKIGEVGIFIRESYSFTDEEGNTQSTERSSSNTLSQSNESTFATSDTQSSENTDSFSQELGTEFTFGGEDPFGGFTITAEVGFEQTRQRGFSTSVSSESARASSEEFQNSIASGNEFSENRSFTRSIEEARLNTDVTISNLGDVAFTISDLELSAFVRDPIARMDVPLATMLSERSIAGEDQQFNLGPFDSERGPFIFRDIQIFPNVAEQLRAAPQSLTIKLANFNIRDESGRLFAFSSQDINDRTAGIVIDYGNGAVESHRVATAGRFDENGRSVGITMGTALQDILELTYVDNERTSVADASLSQAIQNSYATVTDSDTGQRYLTRFRGVQTDVIFDEIGLDQKFWALVASVPVPENVDFNDIVLKAGANYSLEFVADLDDDGLFARTEYIYGSSDLNPDTDGDGLSDFEEVREGWLVDIPGNAYLAFSDPVRPDSDGDGKDDATERAFGTDPRRADTDQDGISDADEIDGYTVVLADEDNDPENNPTIDLQPYIYEAIVAGADGRADTPAANGDEQVQPVGTGGLDTEALVVVSGPDGVLSTTPVGNDILRPFHNRLYASDPLRRDSDGDGLADGREVVLGSNPNNPTDSGSVSDTDEDGLTDNEELLGWVAIINGSPQMVTSNPQIPDTDGDGVPDLMESLYALNPNAFDSDGDGLDDYEELDAQDARGYFPDGTFNAFTQKCNDAPECRYVAPVQPIGTDPRRADTDGDGLNDNQELSEQWTVAVFNRTPYDVASSPFSADADGDGLNDLAERNAGLDPTSADTDGDATHAPLATRNDRAELNGITDPLKPDMIVRHQFVSILVDGDCDGTPTDPAGIELEGGELFLLAPDDIQPVQVFGRFECIRERQGTVEQGLYSDISNQSLTRQFVLEIGQSYTVSSGDFIDHDNDGCVVHNEDDLIGRINNEQQAYPETEGNFDYSIVGGAGCGIRVRATITVE